MITYISNKVTKALGLIALTGLSGLMNAQAQNWSLAGPVYNAGRIRNIVIDKTDATGKTIYAGSTSSGVFKTTDGASNWAPTNDQGTVRNISYMAQAVDGIIYFGTGEGFLRPGQLQRAQPGTGFYKLVNDVPQLVAPASMVGEVINRVACSPANAQVIALATNKGIWISQDGGGTFTAGTGLMTTTVNATFGMDVKFDNAGNLYCSMGNERSVGSAGGATFLSVKSRVYKAQAASLLQFTDITPTSGQLADQNYGRIELAIAPSDNNVIYASCARKSNNGPSAASLYGLFVSTDGGSNWDLVLAGSPALDPLSNGGTIASGDYSQVIVVNPTNPDQLFIGGYQFYMYTKNSGANTWLPIGNSFAINTPFYLHENIHDIKIVPGTPATFYFVTDAGIYRSIDLATSNMTLTPSFQPFYKGLVTGQFNSVSIEAFPISSTSGGSVIPQSGFIGGTSGNGLNYFSGTSENVYQETNYLTGEVYNAEFSKILPDAALMSLGNGSLYRSTNVKTSQPTAINVNSFTGPLSMIASTSPPPAFTAVGVETGTPFKLWENYGQFANGPDAVVFYNDSTRFPSSIGSVSSLTTQTTFTFSASRPNAVALIDSIVIRTATVSLPVPTNSVVSTPFNNRLDINIKLSNNYAVNSGTAITVPPISGTLGPVSAAGVTLSPADNTDIISVTFTAPPFAMYTEPSYYRVFATVFYKYKAGDVITLTDNNISTKTNTYSTTLTQPLSWQYGSALPDYTISAGGAALAVSDPTYVLTPDNITQPTPVFTVQPITTQSYTITNAGNYTVSAIPVSYTISAATDTNIPGNPNYSFVLMPGNVTQTTAVFTVTPTDVTQYTITQSSASSTMTSETFSTLSTSYTLEPGTVVQTTPDFTIAVPVGASPVTYTITGGASDPSGVNTSTTYAFPVITSTTVGSSTVPFAENNKIVKIPTRMSARLATVYGGTGVTGLGSAVVVSKAPLNLNDPLNFVRLSQNGCLTTNPDGTPSPTATIAIPGKATILQWSYSGTELYYATDDNKLYRVSYIDLIMDFSPSSYSGKLNTDLFLYNPTNSTTGGVGNPGPSAIINPNSPYRTTLIGTFTKKITSISISPQDTALTLTFDDPTGIPVMYSSKNVKKANASTVNFVSKTGTGLTNVKTYCSLMEALDPSKHAVYIGTDNGIYYTSDITASSPTWVNANNNQLPNVQIFDIKQQTMRSWESYNSGQIYVATNGRGVWTNNEFLQSSVVSVEEIEKDKKVNNISIFPNPTNGNVSISFNGIDGESAMVNVMDLSGRVVKTESLGKLTPGEATYSLETSSLTSGIYLVNVTSTSGVKRVAKLIVSK